jgi:hypothetical protein
MREPSFNRSLANDTQSHDGQQYTIPRIRNPLWVLLNWRGMGYRTAAEKFISAGEYDGIVCK